MGSLEQCMCPGCDRCLPPGVLRHPPMKSNVSPYNKTPWRIFRTVAPPFDST